MNHELREAIEKTIEIGCIRMFWAAKRPCDEYDDGRQLCGICALRVAFVNEERRKPNIPIERQ